MISNGVLASQLIRKLQEAIEKWGDKQVFIPGNEYPEGVQGVSYIPPEKGSSYVPGDSFYIW